VRGKLELMKRSKSGIPGGTYGDGKHRMPIVRWETFPKGKIHGIRSERKHRNDGNENKTQWRRHKNFFWGGGACDRGAAESFRLGFAMGIDMGWSGVLLRGPSRKRKRKED